MLFSAENRCHWSLTKRQLLNNLPIIVIMQVYQSLKLIAHVEGEKRRVMICRSADNHLISGKFFYSLSTSYCILFYSINLFNFS